MSENKLSEQNKLDENQNNNNTTNNNENVIAGLSKESVDEALYTVDKNIDVNTFESEVEEQRKQYFEKANRSRLISKISNAILIVIAVIGLVLLFIDPENDVYNYVGYGLTGGAILLLVIVYIILRFIRPDASKYIAFITKTFNNYTYLDSRYSKVIADSNERIQLAQVSSDKVYLGISDIGSRNVCKGYFNKNQFIACELSLGAKDKSGTSDLFLGKYITYENLLKFDGRIIINIKLSDDGSIKNFDLPSDILDLKEVVKDKTLTIYSSEGLHYQDIVDDKFLDLLTKFTVSNESHLLNINVVIWGGHSAIYLSYDNEILSLPYKNVFTKDNILKLAQDQLQALELLQLLLKDKHIKTDEVATVKEEDLPKENN